MSSAVRSPLRVFGSVLFALWFRELKTRYTGERAGWLWAIIGPLTGVIIFTVMAGQRGRDLMFGVDYPIYLLTGFVPFGIVTQSISLAMSAIESNAGLFIYRQVKPFDVIVARVLQTVLIETIILVILCGLGAWLGYTVMPNDPLLVLVLWIVTVALSLGLALCTAIIAHRFQQARNVISLLMRPMFFISGVIFPLSAVPDDLKIWLAWNPLLHLLELIRHAWFAGFPLDSMISWPLLVWPTIGALALGMLAYRSQRDRLVAA